MFYLLENNRIIDSIEELKKGTSVASEINTGFDNIKHNYLVGHFFGGFCVYGKIKKQSKNVYDLIEKGDLVLYFNNIYEVKKFEIEKEIVYMDTQNGICFPSVKRFMELLSTIYKPNEKGDYIKVWEKKDE